MDVHTLGRAAASGGKVGMDAGCAATAGAAGRARSACASNATARSLSRGQLATARRQSSAASCNVRRSRAETVLETSGRVPENNTTAEGRTSGLQGSPAPSSGPAAPCPCAQGPGSRSAPGRALHHSPAPKSHQGHRWSPASGPRKWLQAIRRRGKAVKAASNKNMILPCNSALHLYGLAQQAQLVVAICAVAQQLPKIGAAGCPRIFERQINQLDCRSVIARSNRSSEWVVCHCLGSRCRILVVGWGTVCSTPGGATLCNAPPTLMGSSKCGSQAWRAACMR